MGQEKAPIKTSSGKVHQPSELALLMREMYVNMTLAQEFLKEGESVPDSLLSGYQGIFTAEATNPRELTAEFEAFGKMWMNAVDTLQANQDLDSYNAVMDACVNCHQTNCPGPIKKIKRLKLVP